MIKYHAIKSLNDIIVIRLAVSIIKVTIMTRSIEPYNLFTISTGRPVMPLVTGTNDKKEKDAMSTVQMDTLRQGYPYTPKCNNRIPLYDSTT